MGETERVVVGRVVKPHGIQGEVVVRPTGDDPRRFQPGMVLHLEEGGTAALTVEEARPHDGAVLVRFEGRTDRDAAEDLRGAVLYLEASRLPPLPEGVYYHFQLVGLRVTRPDGDELGRIVRVLDLPAGDLYEVRGGGRTWLIPAREEFVAWVDLEKREVRLTGRDDLLEAQ